MYTFIVLAQEQSSGKVLVFAVKEKNNSEAEGRVAKYINANMEGGAYAIRTRYTIADTKHVQLLEVNDRV